MGIADWLVVVGLFVTVLVAIGSLAGFLNAKVNKDVEAVNAKIDREIHTLWERAKDQFATREGVARIEGKIDTILVKLEEVVKDIKEKRDA